MIRKTIILSGLIFSLAICSAYAGDESAGYAASFLEIPIGARAAAMGGAYMGISDDGAGLLYNPAGLANMKKKLFTSSYRAMKLDRSLAYISILFPTQGNSVLGVNWLYAGSGSVEARNSLGQLSGHDVSFNSHDFGILFAKRFENYLSAGLKINYFQSNFTEINSGTVGIDFGIMIYFDQLVDREKRDQMPVQNIQLGVAVKNIGARLVWNNSNYVRRYFGSNTPGSEQVDNVPTEFAIGGAASFLNKTLNLAVDLLKHNKSNIRFHTGAEYLVDKKFAIRAGLSDGSFTAGTGYLFKLGGNTLAIDYAFSSDKAGEGEEHIFSFDILF